MTTDQAKEKHPIIAAVERAFPCDCDISNPGHDDWCPSLFRARVTALIREVLSREPSEEMHEAGNDEMDKMDLRPGPYSNGNAMCEHIWKAMCSTLLAEIEGK